MCVAMTQENKDLFSSLGLGGSGGGGTAREAWDLPPKGGDLGEDALGVTQALGEACDLRLESRDLGDPAPPRGRDDPPRRHGQPARR